MCSATVLANYLETGNSSDKVPWSDLRYIFGDILYGGHITDNVIIIYREQLGRPRRKKRVGLGYRGTHPCGMCDFSM
jgi:hypothetical protein